MKPLNLLGKRGMLSLDVVTYAPRCVGQTGRACEGDASIANALKKAIARATSPTNGNHLIAIPYCFSDSSSIPVPGIHQMARSLRGVNTAIMAVI